jgi:hypothetical protein
MKSIQHVLWRGALALGLMAVGIGSGLGMGPAEQPTAAGDCPAPPRDLVADQVRADAVLRQDGHTVIVLRGPANPAG